MVADQRFVNSIMGEKLAGPPRIFGGDQVHLFQNPQSPQRNVLKVADGSRDDIKNSRRRLIFHDRNSPREIFPRLRILTHPASLGETNKNLTAEHAEIAEIC
jgi:hypothetical protein